VRGFQSTSSSDMYAYFYRDAVKYVSFLVIFEAHYFGSSSQRLSILSADFSADHRDALCISLHHRSYLFRFLWRPSFLSDILPFSESLYCHEKGATELARPARNSILPVGPFVRRYLGPSYGQTPHLTGIWLHSWLPSSISTKSYGL
jgi:hypothetical protein